MEEDILTEVALANESDYSFGEQAPTVAVPELPDPFPETPQPQPKLNKRFAFKAGCFARYTTDASQARDNFMRSICDLPQATQQVLRESFEAGLRKGRDPDLPEKAAAVVKSLAEERPILTKTKLGRSPHYPRLLMMAFIIGHDGKPFTFAKHRISEALGVPSVTVQNFIGLGFQWQLIDYVCPGVPGLHGAPAWYHLWIDNVREELEIDDAKERRILDLLKVAK